MSCTVHLSIESVSLKNLCLSIANITLIKAEPDNRKICSKKLYLKLLFHISLIWKEIDDKRNTNINIYQRNRKLLLDRRAKQGKYKIVNCLEKIELNAIISHHAITTWEPTVTQKFNLTIDINSFSHFNQNSKSLFLFIFIFFFLLIQLNWKKMKEK